MIVLLCEPGKHAREEAIQHDMKSMQAIVGGTIDLNFAAFLH
jgi:hypothetical protein